MSIAAVLCSNLPLGEKVQRKEFGLTYEMCEYVALIIYSRADYLTIDVCVCKLRLPQNK